MRSSESKEAEKKFWEMVKQTASTVLDNLGNKSRSLLPCLYCRKLVDTHYKLIVPVCDDCKTKKRK